MLALRILGGAALVLALLCMVRVRFRLRARDGMAALRVQYGLLTVWRYPAVKKRKKRPSRKKKKEPEEEPEEEERERPPLLPMVREALRTLPKPIRRALTRLLRGFRLKPFSLTWVIGGLEDPPAAAVLYGRANAAVWAVMPLLERTLDIPDPEIHIGVDFGEPEHAIEGDAGLSVRLGTLLAAGIGAGIPVLRLLLSFSRMAREYETETEPETDESGGTDSGEPGEAERDETGQNPGA